MTTIKDVAKKAGVSISTVSRVLSNKVPVNAETRVRVVNAVKELDYQPNLIAKGLKGGSTNTIGLIIPDISNPYYPKIARSVEEQAKKNGYSLILCNTEESLKEELMYVDMLKKRYVDGIIFITVLKESNHILKLKRSGFPVVQLDRCSNPEVDCVTSDNVYGAYIMTKHLIENGHRNIAIIAGNMDMQIYVDRFLGCMMALNEMDVKISDEYIAKNAVTVEDAYESMMKFLKMPQRPTAVFSPNDIKTLGVYKAIRDCNLRIPEDISVVGYDNIDISEYMDPPLTTFEQPVKAMGAQAVERLVDQIEKTSKIECARIVLQGSMVIRRSVRNINEAAD